jgi:hypothetical protein
MFQKVQAEIIVRYGAYACRKVFELSVPPHVGWTLEMGTILLHAKHVTQDLDKDLFRVFCEAEGHETIWRLWSSQTGWTVSNPEAFQKDSEVKRAVQKHKKSMARVFAEVGVKQSPQGGA